MHVTILPQSPHPYASTKIMKQALKNHIKGRCVN